jgi:hypothetical protein
MITEPTKTDSTRDAADSPPVAAGLGATQVMSNVEESLQTLESLAAAPMEEDDQSLQSSIADFMSRLFGESGRAVTNEASPQVERIPGPAAAAPSKTKPQPRNPRAPEQPTLISDLRDAANAHARDLLVDCSRRQRQQIRRTWLLGLLAVACTLALIGAAQRGATPAWYGAWVTHGAAMICTAQLFRLGKRPARGRDKVPAAAESVHGG